MTNYQFNLERAREIDRMYASPDISAQRNFVMELLALNRGECVVDIGSGPGYLLAEMADVVGPTGDVCGLDQSVDMNNVARKRNSRRSWVRVDEGDVLSLPYPSDTFDVAVSTQVYEYVTDIPRALGELRRVMKPGGRVVILDTDWDSLVWNTENRVLHQRICDAWEEHLVHPRLPRVIAQQLRRAGFTLVSQRVHVLMNTELGENSFSAAAMRSIADFVPGHRGVTKADAEEWVMDLLRRECAGEYFYSLNRYACVGTA